ncbi:hypothetical protein, partial [Janthinobacterium sp.]|uniref:hypothetical protein n=1 Tax=Janthinobacterium sp. TaxID=1871054 RepID=UPI00261FD50C
QGGDKGKQLGGGGNGAHGGKTFYKRNSREAEDSPHHIRNENHSQEKVNFGEFFIGKKVAQGIFFNYLSRHWSTLQFCRLCDKKAY